MRSSKPILLVEDDRVDAMMVKRALDELKVTNQLVHLSSGKEALGHLKNPDNEKPCLILLDLRMPQANGIEFLKRVKADERLKSIPVVVLTSSTEERDVIETFSLGIAGYILKPVDYKNFVEAMRTVALYWTLSELPEDG